MVFELRGRIELTQCTENSDDMLQIIASLSPVHLAESAEVEGIGNNAKAVLNVRRKS